jgi:hypothetical protein
MERAIAQRYADPVDAVWVNAARRLGLHGERASAAFAAREVRGAPGAARPTADGRRVDDCLAQRVLHHLCHALVAGDEALESTTLAPCDDGALDATVEHATQRVQAALADRYGLRALMAVTGEQRAHWDALPDDPLARAGDPAQQPAVELALAAWLRSRKTPFRNVLYDALAATAAIAHAVRASAPADSLWAQTLPPHATGFALHRNPARHCHDCAWHAQLGPGKPSSRCRQTLRGPATQALRIDPAARACERWEPRLEGSDGCAPCGACCREGFDLVHVRPRERAARLLAAQLQPTAYGLSLPRPGGLCVALEGERATAGPYRCRIYADRPRSCADFAVASDACLEARRRVGLSR